MIGIFYMFKERLYISLERWMDMRTYMFHFLIFYSISFVQTQFLPFLTMLGYSITEKGFLLASCAIIAVIVQFWLGYKSDTSNHSKRYYIMTYIMFLCSACFLYTTTKQMFFVHIILVAISGGLVKVLMGYDETWMLADQQYDYGRLRAVGSLGFTVGALCASFFMNQYHISLIITIFCIMGILFLYLLSHQHVVLHKTQTYQFSWSILRKNKAYIQVVVALTLIYLIGSADQYLVIDKLQALDATRQQIGLKWALQAFVEIPILLYSTRLLHKISQRSLILFGIAMFGIKFFLYGYVSSVQMIILVAALQIVTLPLIMVASKQMIQKLCPKEVFASAQLVAIAIFTGASMLCSPLLSSYLYKHLGINQSLYALSGCMLVPFFIIYRMKKTNKHD